MFDEYEQARMVPTKCACCNKCWLYIEGHRLGTCCHGGPYKGYVNIYDETIELQMKILDGF